MGHTEAGRGNVKCVDLGDCGPIDRGVIALRKATGLVYTVAKGTRAIESIDMKTAQAYQAALEGLSQLLLNPLWPLLSEADHLLISPDSALWLFPWAP